MYWIEFDRDAGNKVLGRASERELREAFTDPDQR